MQYAIPHHGFYVIKLHYLKRSLFCNPYKSKKEIVARVVFGSFPMVMGSQMKEGN
jgi:hypothetical protein